MRKRDLFWIAVGIINVTYGFWIGTREGCVLVALGTILIVGRLMLNEWDQTLQLAQDLQDDLRRERAR